VTGISEANNEATVLIEAEREARVGEDISDRDDESGTDGLPSDQVDVVSSSDDEGDGNDLDSDTIEVM
jgi:hypothetical protein